MYYGFQDQLFMKNLKIFITIWNNDLRPNLNVRVFCQVGWSRTPSPQFEHVLHKKVHPLTTLPPYPNQKHTPVRDDFLLSEYIGGIKM